MENKKNDSGAEVTVKSAVKSNPPNRRKTFREIFTFRNISILFFLISFLIVGYYIIFPSRGEFHADCTDTIMWAQVIYDTGNIFDADFEYACLLAFGGQWLMVPFIAIFGMGMTAQVLGMFTFFILFIASLYGMLRTMKISFPWSLTIISVTILMLSSSKKLREIFWGHIIYYSLGMLYAFVGLALIFRMINIISNEKKPENKKNFIITGALLLIWCILAGANQLEILTLFLIPAIGALIVERFFCFEKYKSKKELLANLIILGIVVVGTGAGYLLGNAIIGDISASYASGSSNLTNTDDWWEHLSRFFPHLAYLIGMPDTSGTPLLSLDGINALLRIMMSAILIAIPVITTILWPKIKNRQIRIFIVFHWIMTFFIMIGYICGMLSSANWRLSPIVCTSVIMMAILAQWIWENTDKKRLGVLTMLPLLVLSLWSVKDISAMPKDYNQDGGLYAVSDYLVENNLTYGYATFWSANAMTVISDSKAETRCIRVSDEGICTPNYYQSRKSWYEDQPDQPNYFLLLSQYEFECMVNNSNPLLDEPHYQADVDGYIILTFEHNIF